jgi:hypothetical protein
MKRNAVLAVIVACLLSVFTLGWHTYAQSRTPMSQPSFQRGWEYNYDTASKSFPEAADKAKIAFYDNNGWELTAVVREDYQTVLVFKRLRQPSK